MTSDDERLKQAGRLALRHEGNMWNAYFAKPDTMEGAILIGSIAIEVVKDNVERKNAFARIMSDFVSDMLEKIVGVRPDFMAPRDPPEHEKSGHSLLRDRAP